MQICTASSEHVDCVSFRTTPCHEVRSDETCASNDQYVRHWNVFQLRRFASSSLAQSHLGHTSRSVTLQPRQRHATYLMGCLDTQRRLSRVKKTANERVVCFRRSCNLCVGCCTPVPCLRLLQSKGHSFHRSKRSTFRPQGRLSHNSRLAGLVCHRTRLIASREVV